ncbi:DUF4126 domain-containing protein [Hymenobacter sp. RP-2-7]|uniref:DUF4126 domain-containing protein n=1 Tax=Hymenobacter polaris TaxID=2682546 RepID=A0A7Y0FP15_9BACT|nr:DUF4126 domain-containing protein [Hymenobacter polaris]NML67528.1 DUF4126 domain-containing protein [Hymenobacter polaris]
MKKKTPRPAKFWPTLGFAALAGSRATSAPAFLSQYLSHQALSPALAKSPLRFFARPGVTIALELLVAGEIVGDKMPSAPDRTVPQQLATRTASGALVGATLYKAKGGNALVGALVGGLGTVAATYATWWLRTQASQQFNLDSGLVGAGEDALVLAAGTALAKAQGPTTAQ